MSMRICKCECFTLFNERTSIFFQATFLTFKPLNPRSIYIPSWGNAPTASATTEAFRILGNHRPAKSFSFEDTCIQRQNISSQTTDVHVYWPMLNLAGCLIFSSDTRAYSTWLCRILSHTLVGCWKSGSRKYTLVNMSIQKYTRSIFKSTMLDTVYYLDTWYVAHDVSGTGYTPVWPCISNSRTPHTTENGNTK
jgi:hypothetical protein